jgi:hypothetical protein
MTALKKLLTQLTSIIVFLSQRNNREITELLRAAAKTCSA